MTALRRLGRWLWSLKDWRIVQADDPIGLMGRGERGVRDWVDGIR